MLPASVSTSSQKPSSTGSLKKSWRLLAGGSEVRAGTWEGHGDPLGLGSDHRGDAVLASAILRAAPRRCWRTVLGRRKHRGWTKAEIPCAFFLKTQCQWEPLGRSWLIIRGVFTFGQPLVGPSCEKSTFRQPGLAEGNANRSLDFPRFSIWRAPRAARRMGQTMNVVKGIGTITIRG